MTKTNVPRLRFRGFEEEWKFGHLSDVGLVKMNKRIHKNETKDTGDVPFFKIGTFGKKPDAFITRNRFLELKEHYPYPKPGDILISASGTLGRTVVYEGKDEYFQDSNIIWLDLNNKEMINLFLLQFYKQHIWKSEGTTIKRLYNKDIYSTSISYPSVYEQKKIGTFFAKIDKLIELQTKKLEQLKKLKQGYLQKMFPQDGESEPRLRFSGFSGEWKNKQIGDISSSSKGNGLSKDDINEDRQGFPVVHYADIYKFDNIVSDVIHWSEKDEGKIIPNNSVIFPMSDVTPNGLAKCSVVKIQDVKAGGDVLIFSMKQGISAEYISYFISANKKKILRLVSGTSVKHISSKSVNKVDILLPNLSEQNKISEFFKNLDQMIRNQTDKINELKQQKKAYLQNMFV